MGETNDTRRILVLMAHTGSGHLRAAEAVKEALRRQQGAAVVVDIVDAVGLYAPFPFDRLATIYPWWINKAIKTWDWGYTITNGCRRSQALLRLFWPLVWPRARRLFDRHPADTVVSLHPLTNHYAVWALRRLGRDVPTVTLVTDPVSVHPFWFSPDVERCLVGSAEARRTAIACRLRSDRVYDTGLPVNPCFVDGLLGADQARRALGWSSGQPGVLVLGGGEGMGHLFDSVRAIDKVCRDIQVAVVTGRNLKLRERIETTTWRLPVHVYGYVDHSREMSCLMSAADVLVTKAGPGSLHEAFLAGLPVVLSGAIPGQEEGNVRLVVEGGAGVYAPVPEDAASFVARWTADDRAELDRMAACSRALARPNAAAAVADHIWQVALINL
jgi:1,2-diacylglycerol 3-beta-galactosyltransferase